MRTPLPFIAFISCTYRTDLPAKQGFAADPSAAFESGATMTILNFLVPSNLPVEMVSLPMKQRASPFDEDRKIAGPTDGKLVQKTLAGHRPAFDELIRRYQRQAVAVSYRLLGSTQDALEVTQDAFLKAYIKLRSLQKPEAFGGWLMRIVSNLSLNFRRGRKSRSQLPLDDLLASTDNASADRRSVGNLAIGNVDPAHQLESAEMGQCLRHALRQLPDKQRSAIILFTIEQMPQKQVAQMLNCSVEAVKWHVFQGRKKLKEILKDYL
jgi:RNA polymerase sigma-70 factor (ECF subfamily)